MSDILSDESDEPQSRSSSPLNGKSKKQQKRPSKIKRPEIAPFLDSADGDYSAESDSEEKGTQRKSKQHLTRAPSPIFEEDVKRAAAHRASGQNPKRDNPTRLAVNIEEMSLNDNKPSQVKIYKPTPREIEDVDMDDSVVILPTKAGRVADSRDAGKKKKR